MKVQRILSCICIFFLITSCKEEKTQTDSIFNYREYISYTTFGEVSVHEKIVINLAKDVEKLNDKKQDLNTLFSIKPFVKGKLTLVNKNVLHFIPNKKLASNTEYTAQIKLNKIYKDVPEASKDYTFQFKTIKPSFTIQTNTIQSYSKEWQYVNGIVKSADVISLINAKKLIKATQKGNVKKIIWNESFKQGKVFEFKIDSIQRYEEESRVVVNWDGKPIKADESGESKIVITGKNNFKIISVEVKNETEQYLSINFSDALKQQQNFDGLVTIQNVKKPNFIINGNELKVYHNLKLSGNILVSIYQGIKNTEDYKLKKDFTETVVFEEKKPEIRLISNGVILPNSKDLKFNFEAVNVKEVDVRIIKVFEDNVLQFLQHNNLKSNNEYAIKQVGRRITKKTITLVKNKEKNTGKWKAYSIDLSKIFIADKGAIYRVEISFNKNQVLYKCDNTLQKTVSIKKEFNDEDLKEELYWDNKIYNYKNQNYNWRERDNPCKDTYYYNRTIAQNLLASNIGIIAKKGTNNSYFFAATNILNTKPQVNATLKLFNFQQQEIASVKTDKKGFAKVKLNKNAAFVIVSKGKNKGYLKLEDGNSLSLSKFDVSGTKLQKGLKGFLYGERGVWRPGDSIHLTFILNDVDNKLPENHPIKIEILDPNDKLIYKKITTEKVNNFYKFTVVTTPESITGNYSAKVSVGGAKFYKNLKVETVKPNRLKIKVDFKEKILSAEKPITGNLQVNWLHGTPAKNLKTEIKAKIKASNYIFKDYKKYLFTDPTRTFSPEEITIFEGKLNQKGAAKIKTELVARKNAPGMLDVQFLVRAFENGGDFSIDAFTKKYAPFSSFVGLKLPKANKYNSYFTDEDQRFSIVSVNAKGKPIQRKGIEVKVYKIEWRWWWSSTEDNLSKYTSSNYYKPYKTIKLNTNTQGKASFKLNVEDEDRGRFLIRVLDSVSNHATGSTAYFYKDWWQNSGSKNKEAAKMLVFSADKEKYNVGETAKITFPSGNAGRALVSVENGTEVLETKWVKTEKGQTTTSIFINKKMAPNVFVNISLLQPHQVTENDLPIRLYGTIPLLVEDSETKLQPEISMPKELQPQKEFNVYVSEKNKKAMTYTLAIVEDGLLDLTRFKTPNAFNKFFAKEALGVKTWDIFDDVIGAYSGSVDQVFAIGGDENLEKGKNRKANRFKPIVTYLGPFNLKKGERKTHKIKLPNYIGSVRTMVVAGDVTKEAFGSAEKTVPVKKPLMVLATLPRKLSPKEKVILPVTVFAMDKKMKNVQIDLKTTKGITVVGSKTKTVNFEKPDEKMVYFELDVQQENGINTIEVIAKGNGEKATYKVAIDVVNPNLISSKIIDKKIDKNKTQQIDFETFGVLGTNTATLELSTIPQINFSGRLNYLIQYPHGCLEQTTSSVFPQLFLNDIFDLTVAKKQKIQKNIEKGIKRLGNFQQANGGMSYWLEENFSNDWGTNYAGHFMLEAEKKGFVLPLTFKSNFIRYQKNAARNWKPSYRNNQSDLTQAYRLYTLALAGSPDLSAMNRLREFKQISNEAKWRLAAAYALASQKEAANEIMNGANLNFQKSKNDYHTYGSANRNRAMALETMLITNNTNVKETSNSIAKALSSNRWMSTQTTAFSLLAIAKMVINNGGKELNVSYTNNNKTINVNSQNSFAQRAINVKKGKNTIQIKNNENNIVFARVIYAGKLPIGKEVSEKRGFNISIKYASLKGNTIDIKQLKQGEDFVANITVSNLKNESIKDIALTQIFPSGWEIVNTRFTDFGTSVKSSARYTDIRDSSVKFYFDLEKTKTKPQTKTFSVLLNAAYLGRYYLPGTQLEAMYDNDYLVKTKGFWVEVIK